VGVQRQVIGEQVDLVPRQRQSTRRAKGPVKGRAPWNFQNKP